MSDFWRRVDEELEYLGKNRTYLANKCEFSLTNFNLGIKRGSTPSAETAVKWDGTLWLLFSAAVLFKTIPTGS